MLFLVFTVLGFAAQAQTDAATQPKGKEVEASCGQCNFGLKGSGCSLAVKIDGKAYFVDGSSLDEHGDAHGDSGMCNVIRKAMVEGEVVNGRFKATSFVLLPEKKEEKPEAK